LRREPGRADIMDINHVDGRKKGKVMLYALSTCGWCKKTKELLNELGVEYYYTHVDLLKGSEQTAAIGEIQKFNPDGSFPTLVLDDKKCIVGYKEDDIRKALGYKGS
jgi:glutaredoxin-like protein NrdH